MLTKCRGLSKSVQETFRIAIEIDFPRNNLPGECVPCRHQMWDSWRLEWTPSISSLLAYSPIAGCARRVVVNLCDPKPHRSLQWENQIGCRNDGGYGFCARVDVIISPPKSQSFRWSPHNRQLMRPPSTNPTPKVLRRNHLEAWERSKSAGVRSPIMITW